MAKESDKYFTYSSKNQMCVEGNQIVFYEDDVLDYHRGISGWVKDDYRKPIVFESEEEALRVMKIFKQMYEKGANQFRHSVSTLLGSEFHLRD